MCQGKFKTFLFFSLAQLFDEISKGSNQFCFGLENTLRELEAGHVETLIIWQKYDVVRCILHNKIGQTKIVYLHANQQYEMDVHFEQIEKISLVNWLAENDKNLGKRGQMIYNLFFC